MAKIKISSLKGKLNRPIATDLDWLWVRGDLTKGRLDEMADKGDELDNGVINGSEFVSWLLENITTGSPDDNNATFELDEELSFPDVKAIAEAVTGVLNDLMGKSGIQTDT